MTREVGRMEAVVGATLNTTMLREMGRCNDEERSGRWEMTRKVSRIEEVVAGIVSPGFQIMGMPNPRREQSILLVWRP